MKYSGIIGKYFTENGRILPVEAIRVLENIQFQLYEVLRVIDGKPLFWENHFERLQHSAQISGMNIDSTYSAFHEQLVRLIETNQLTEGNIRCDLFRFESGSVHRFSVVPHNYPTSSEYADGVRVGLLHGERKNPHVKVVLHELRDRANQTMTEKKLYEVLLVDHAGLITEGSRSNVFFIKGNQFITPRASKVLLGITRMKVIECISWLGYDCMQQDIHFDALADFDAAFLTGTSPKVLPVSGVDSIPYHVHNELLDKLRVAFDRYISDYLNSSGTV